MHCDANLANWAWLTPADLSPFLPTTAPTPQAPRAAAQPHPAALSGKDHFTLLSIEPLHALVTWFKHSPSLSSIYCQSQYSTAHPQILHMSIKGHCIEQNYSFAFKLPFFFSLGKPFHMLMIRGEKWYWHTPARAWQSWQSNAEIQITDSTKTQVNSYFCHERTLNCKGFVVVHMYIFKYATY